jgi:hypothetical protein
VTVEAARGRPAAVPCAPDVGAGGGRRWPVGPCGGLGWPGGRGPVGEGRENRLVKKRDWAERPGGPKVTGKILFRIKFDFSNIPRLWKFAQGDLGGILT